ncbi:MAG: Efflux transporter, RND family, MFP subunit, partial [Candidatus Peregrinibacteria bacterium GW2011_GWA2_54_9]
VALQKAKRALEKYELRAPFDGIVRRIDFQVGDNLLADANETKYVVLENPDYFIVTVQLDQVDVVHVKEGQKASIVFDALPEETFEGVIDFIDTTPIQSSGVVSYEVEIALQPTGHTILSGMTAKVEIEIDARENVVAVPNLALRAIGNSSFVVGENGERFPVETGLSDGTYTEVLSGLQEGAKIQSVNVSISSNQDGERSERSSNNAQMIMRMGGPPR